MYDVYEYGELFWKYINTHVYVDIYNNIVYIYWWKMISSFEIMKIVDIFLFYDWKRLYGSYKLSI